MENRYGSLGAWVYDLDKPAGCSFGDIEYYATRLAGIEGPVLEPAVGNGRIFVPLLQAGIDLTGFDASEEMLSYCRQYCVAQGFKADLSRQRFEDFSYGRRFAAIIVPAGSFHLITDLDTARAVLRRFRDALLPGGRLILDLNTAGSVIETGAPVRQWATGEEGLLVLSSQRVLTDHVSQRTLTHLRYEHWRAGALVASELDLFGLRWWGLFEFELALREAGFADVTVSAGFEYGHAPYAEDHTVTFEAVAA